MTTKRDSERKSVVQQGNTVAEHATPDYNTDFYLSLIDQHVGRYMLKRSVGIGGMGAVFETHHDGFKDRCAIKIMKADDERHSDSLLTEARKLKDLKYKNKHIVHVFDCGKVQLSLASGSIWCAYLVMDLLEGLTLDKKISSGYRPTLPAILHYAYQIADTCALLHRQQMIHRDIKPENIMLMPPTDDEPSGELLFEDIVIIDFGLAKTITHRRRTAPHGPLARTSKKHYGSAPYMAPERWESPGTETAKSDVYSLGIVICEMITGRLPFNGTTAEIRSQHLGDKLPPLLISGGAGIPPELTALVGEMLSQAPEQRPTMSMAAERLRALKADYFTVSNAAGERCPFPGILASADHPTQALLPIYHNELSQACEALTEHDKHWFLIDGPQFSGKTNLLQAIIITVFERLSSAPPLIITIQDPNQFLAELSRIFWHNRGRTTGSPYQKTRTADDIYSQLLTDERALQQLSEHFFNQTNRDVVLVIDSLEWWLDLEPQSLRVVDRLVAYALGASYSSFYLVSTIRRDSLRRLSVLPMLSRLLDNAHRIPVPSLDSRSIKDAIVQTVRDTGLRISDALAAQIANEAVSHGVELPIISHTLRELWKRREGAILTETAYAEIGGVRKALIAALDYAFIQAANEKLRAQHLLTALVRCGRGGTDSSRLLSVQNAIRIAGSGEIGKQLLAKLSRDDAISQGSTAFIPMPLVYYDQESGTVRISHEIIISRWPILRDSVSLNRKALERWDEIEAAASVWSSTSNPPSLSADLRAFYEGCGLPDEQREFLHILLSDTACRFLAAHAAPPLVPSLQESTARIVVTLEDESRLEPQSAAALTKLEGETIPLPASQVPVDTVASTPVGQRHRQANRWTEPVKLGRMFRVGGATLLISGAIIGLVWGMKTNFLEVTNPQLRPTPPGPVPPPSSQPVPRLAPEPRPMPPPRPRPAPPQPVPPQPRPLPELGIPVPTPRGGPMMLIADASETSPIKTFLIDRTEVTVGAYAECVADHGCKDLAPTIKIIADVNRDVAARCNWTYRSERAQHPINCLSNRQADDFCRWAYKRLPTEPEWLLAALNRSGRTYPWGNNEPTRTSSLCWFAREITCPVDSPEFTFDKSPFGVIGMAGNVAEWTSSHPYGHKDLRYFRGGNYSTTTLAQLILQAIPPSNIRNKWNYKDGIANTIGVRCAADISLLEKSQTSK